MASARECAGCFRREQILNGCFPGSGRRRSLRVLLRGAGGSAAPTAPDGFFRRTRASVPGDARRSRARTSPRAATDAPRPALSAPECNASRYVSESVAEQRLLWRLRGRRGAAGPSRRSAGRRRPGSCVGAPSRLRTPSILARDGRLGLIGQRADAASGPEPRRLLFRFRIVGHFLSVRGARQGLSTCEWQPQPSAPLVRPPRPRRCRPQPAPNASSRPRSSVSSTWRASSTRLQPELRTLGSRTRSVLYCPSLAARPGRAPRLPARGRRRDRRRRVWPGSRTPALAISRSSPIRNTA